MVELALKGADRVTMTKRNGKRWYHELKSTLLFLTTWGKYRWLGTDQVDTTLGLAASWAREDACRAILELGTRAPEIDEPSGIYNRTPLLESVRWNRVWLFRLLRRYGADVMAKAIHPVAEGYSKWSALHVFADQGHNDNLTIVQELIEAGVPVNGDCDGILETPLYIAVRRNAFRLADFLRVRGASLGIPFRNASLFTDPRCPKTALGNLVTLNARNSLPAIRYLLEAGANFVVAPDCGMSVLHVCAQAQAGLAYVFQPNSEVEFRDIDREMNRLIMKELLEWFKEPEQIDLQVEAHRVTALHLATVMGRELIVEELVRAGANKMLRARSRWWRTSGDHLTSEDEGQTAADIARDRWAGNSKLPKLLCWLE